MIFSEGPRIGHGMSVSWVRSVDEEVFGPGERGRFVFDGVDLQAGKTAIPGEEEDAVIPPAYGGGDQHAVLYGSGERMRILPHMKVHRRASTAAVSRHGRERDLRAKLGRSGTVLREERHDHCAFLSGQGAIAGRHIDKVPDRLQRAVSAASLLQTRPGLPPNVRPVARAHARALSLRSSQTARTASVGESCMPASVIWRAAPGAVGGAVQRGMAASHAQPNATARNTRRSAGRARMTWRGAGPQGS